MNKGRMKMSQNQIENEILELQKKHIKFRNTVMTIWLVSSFLFFPLFLLGFFVWPIADGTYGNKIIDLSRKYFEPISYQKFFNVKQYQRDNYVDKDIIDNAKLLNTDGILKGDSLLLADYKGNNLTFGNIRFENGEEPALYNGQWLSCQITKLENFDLRIWAKDAEKWYSSNVYCQEYRCESNYKTNNKEFDSKFKVHTNNSKKAQQILNSEFVELLLSLQNEAGKYIMFSCINNSINIAYSKRFYFGGAKIIKASTIDEMKQICDEVIVNGMKPIVSILEMVYDNIVN